MSKTDEAKTLEANELDATQAQQVAGGDLCSPSDLVSITGALRQSYDNLVDFTSYVIERVVGK